MPTVSETIPEVLRSEVGAALDTNPQLDAPDIPWPLFVAALVANGWFIAPRGFGQRKEGPTAVQRIGIAFARLFAFAILWVAAFVFLPKLPVLLALAGWTAWIVPKVRWLNRAFQSLEER